MAARALALMLAALIVVQASFTDSALNSSPNFTTESTTLQTNATLTANTLIPTTISEEIAKTADLEDGVKITSQASVTAVKELSTVSVDLTETSTALTTTEEHGSRVGVSTTDGSTPVVAGGAGGEGQCPAECACSPGADAEASCQLPRVSLDLSADAGSIVIQCQAGSEFTCEEFPQLPLGQGGAVRLELQYCAPPRVACLARRLHASVRSLYLKYMPREARLEPGLFAGMEQLERLAIFGEKSVNMTIPRDIFLLLPSLQRLTINQATVSIAAGDLDHAASLTYLELTNTGIRELPEGLFRNLKQLETLIFWRNDVDELTEKHFEGLVSLSRLDLSNNRLASLEVVGSLPRLTNLAATGNRLAALPTLSHLTQLQRLDLMDNRVPLTLPPRALAGLPNLTSVDLSRSGISSLPPDLLHNSSTVKVLKLGGNKISSIPPGFFRDASVLEELDLSRNQIKVLRPAGFQDLRSLKTLNLNFNQIEFLPTKMLWGLRVLERLSMRGCGVRGAAAGSLTAPTLQTLDLSHNNLSNLAPTSAASNLQQYAVLGGLLSELGWLRELDVSYNLLEAPPPDLPRSAPHLERLDASHNRITSLTYSDVSFVSAGAVADYRSNRVTSLSLLPALPPAPGAPPASPRDRPTVLLDDNPFECDCWLYPFAQRLHGYTALDTTEAVLEAGAATCAGPPPLRGRRVARVSLHQLACAHFPPRACAPPCACSFRPHAAALFLTCPLPPSTPPDTSALAPLHVSLHLTLTQTPADLDLSLLNLTALNLSSLSLRTVPDIIPPNLELLDLTNNSLEEIPRHLLARDGIKFRLAGNPIECDCWHEASVQALKEFWNKIEDGATVLCTDGLPLNEVSSSSLCSTQRAIIIGGTLAILGLLTAVIALLIVRYSLEIRVWLHARGLLTRWRAIDDVDRTYDAFISFCHKDEEFVREKLLPGLEGNAGGRGKGYRVCVHYRDWVPGEWIPAQIARSVADSRRTLIVLSRNFLDSLWGRAEFRTANMSAIRENQTRVIVVLLEDISSHSELDPELKAYLSTNTYLQWGDPWFWEKLYYALPHRRNEEKPRTNKKGKKNKSGSSVIVNEGVKETGLPLSLSPAGLLVPAALPRAPGTGKPLKADKFDKFDLDLGQLRGLHLDDLKEIKTVEH